MAFFAPLLAAGAGAGGIGTAATIAGVGATAYQGIQAKNAADENARIQQTEGTIAARQGLVAENDQRRTDATEIGRQTAAVGQAGAGYGGSAGRELAQSSENAELNALKIRYKAGLQKWGYDTQAAFTKQEGQDALATSFIRAGGSYLNANRMNPNLGS